jgi:glycine cleavage system H protein
VKAVSDVYAPVSGKIVQVNQALEDAPDLVNQDPYHDGWIAIVELTNGSDLDSLLSNEDYERVVAAEGGHE